MSKQTAGIVKATRFDRTDALVALLRLQLLDLRHQEVQVLGGGGDHRRSSGR